MKKFHIRLLMVSLLVAGGLQAADNDQVIAAANDAVAGHGARFGAIDDAVAGHAGRFDNIDQAVAGHAGRFDALDQAGQAIVANGQAVAANGARLANLEGAAAKFSNVFINGVVHGVGATMVGEYVKALARKRPDQLAKLPFDEEHTNKGLELIGAFGWDLTFKVIQEGRRAAGVTVVNTANANAANAANVANPVNGYVLAVPDVENPAYKAQAYEALKNGEASLVIIIGKFILAKAGEMAGLTEDEIKPWEKLSPSVQWVAGCVLHALVRDQVTHIQGG